MVFCTSSFISLHLSLHLSLSPPLISQWLNNNSLSPASRFTDNLSRPISTEKLPGITDAIHHRHHRTLTPARFEAAPPNHSLKVEGRKFRSGKPVVTIPIFVALVIKQRMKRICNYLTQKVISLCFIRNQRLFSLPTASKHVRGSGRWMME